MMRKYFAHQLKREREEKEIIVKEESEYCTTGIIIYVTYLKITSLHLFCFTSFACLNIFCLQHPVERANRTERNGRSKYSCLSIYESSGWMKHFKFVAAESKVVPTERRFMLKSDQFRESQEKLQKINYQKPSDIKILFDWHWLAQSFLLFVCLVFHALFVDVLVVVNAWKRIINHSFGDSFSFHPQ